MACSQDITIDSFLRKLPFSQRHRLSSSLDVFDTWEKLAAQIPANYNDLFSEQKKPFQARYMSQNLLAFRRYSSPTKALLEDWEYEDCQIRHLIKALANGGLLEAAQVIYDACVQPQQKTNSPTSQAMAENILSIGSTKMDEAPLKDIPIDPPLGFDQHQKKERKPISEHIETMPQIGFHLLSRITGVFDDWEVVDGGRRIGTGGFGHVYLGSYTTPEDPDTVHEVAVKRLKDSDEEAMKQFQTEVKTLCAYKHENLVALLGCSSDGQFPCLVYEYVVNGSLEDRLACINASPPLTVPQRIYIARGTARGLEYLHSKDVTHRDIKSANILLDAQFKPKVSDFATARMLPKSIDMKTKIKETTVVIGTTSYLAPEAYDHKVHHGLDIYSFGVVLLELLTGLLVLDCERENEDLKVHVREYCTPYESDDEDNDKANTAEQSSQLIMDLIDRKRGVDWDETLVEELYSLSKQCLEHCMKRRKKIKFVLSKLEKLNADFGEGEPV